jgi:hypothetical protein
MGGHEADMRMRDHHKADLALAALTLSVAALAAGSEVVRWASRRRHRHTPSAHPPSRAST